MSKREFRLENEYPYNRSGPVRWILSHLFRYPLFPLAMVACAVLNNTAYSYVQIFIGRAFAVITTPGWQTAALLSVALGALGAAVSQGLTGLARNFSTSFIAQRIERDAREELYANLLGKSQTFHGKQRLGDIMARATNDVRMLNIMFSPGIMLIVDSLMALIVPVFIIGTISRELLLVPALFTVMLAITVYDYNRRLKPVSLAQREQFGLLNARLEESIAGIEVVKSNAQERQEWGYFSANARRYCDYFVQQGDLEARYLPMLVFGFAWAGALLHSLILWNSDKLELSQVITFMGLMGALRFPTFISIFSFNLVQMGIASAERILALINVETDLDENAAGEAHSLRGAVTFENVTFAYEASDKPVLRNVSFTIEPGETVAIVGQTGSGKTTLTRLINRIFEASSGRVLVDGVDVRDWSLESLRSQISTIEQDIFLFSRSLAENIAFGVAAPPAAIEQAAREAQAHDFITGFQDGYATEVGERGVTLSGGQRQRIAIARAFLTDPRILILDDSTSAIDSATEDQIQRAMVRISKGRPGEQPRTTFLITHRLSQIRWADRVLVLRRGELVDQGSHAELMERCEPYRRIFARYEI